MLLTGDYESDGHDHAVAFRYAIENGIPSILGLLYAAGAGSFTTGLCVWHAVILYRNQTTAETMKKTWNLFAKNPYDTGNIVKNCMKLFLPI